MAAGSEVLEHAFREPAKGNRRSLVDMAADIVEWSIIGSTEWSETFRGKRSLILDLLRPLAEQIDGPNTVEATCFIAELSVTRRGPTCLPLLLDIRDAARESYSHHRILRHDPRRECSGSPTKVNGRPQACATASAKRSLVLSRTSNVSNLRSSASASSCAAFASSI